MHHADIHLARYLRFPHAARFPRTFARSLGLHHGRLDGSTRTNEACLGCGHGARDGIQRLHQRVRSGAVRSAAGNGHELGWGGDWLWQRNRCPDPRPDGPRGESGRRGHRAGLLVHLHSRNRGASRRHPRVRGHRPEDVSTGFVLGPAGNLPTNQGRGAGALVWPMRRHATADGLGPRTWLQGDRRQRPEPWCHMSWRFWVGRRHRWPLGNDELFPIEELGLHGRRRGRACWASNPCRRTRGVGGDRSTLGQPRGLTEVPPRRRRHQLPARRPSSGVFGRQTRPLAHHDRGEARGSLQVRRLARQTQRNQPLDGGTTLADRCQRPPLPSVLRLAAERHQPGRASVRAA